MRKRSSWVAFFNFIILKKKDMKKKIVRNIIFSKTPLKTQFRFFDFFQIYPCDFPGIPRSKYCDDMPLVIEFWYDENENPKIREDWKEIEEFASPMLNQSYRLTKIIQLLSAITNHRFFNYSDVYVRWGLPIPDEVTEKFNSESSQPILPFFTFPGLSKNLWLNEFSTQNYPATNLIKDQDYYLKDPGEDKNKSITFPLTILGVLQKYYILDDESKKIVDSVAHLICNGIDLRYKMKSLSFLSFVSAIETLVNFEFRDQKKQIEFECPDCQTIKSSPIKCQKCGRPIWGVKAKFRSFLKTYVHNSKESISQYNRIYNLRSEIVHNGMLLLGDEQMNWMKSEKADSQWLTHLEAQQLARVSLGKWLLAGPNKIPVE